MSICEIIMNSPLTFRGICANLNLTVLCETKVWPFRERSDLSDFSRGGETPRNKANADNN